jgi:hypothetical protein
MERNYFVLAFFFGLLFSWLGKSFTFQRGDVDFSPKLLHTMARRQRLFLQFNQTYLCNSSHVHSYLPSFVFKNKTFFYSNPSFCVPMYVMDVVVFNIHFSSFRSHPIDHLLFLVQGIPLTSISSWPRTFFSNDSHRDGAWDRQPNVQISPSVPLFPTVFSSLSVMDIVIDYFQFESSFQPFDVICYPQPYFHRILNQFLLWEEHVWEAHVENVSSIHFQLAPADPDEIFNLKRDVSI